MTSITDTTDHETAFTFESPRFDRLITTIIIFLYDFSPPR